MAQRNGKVSSPMKQLVKGALNDLKNEFPDDERLSFDGSDGQVRAPERETSPLNRKKKDEVLMDAIFSGIAGKDGYFAKLKREVRPGEWMMMKVFETEWRNWPDAEVAITNLVREYTRKSPNKWGTGTYRIEMGCRGGHRGEPPPVHDYCINADEEFLTLPGMGAGQNGNGTTSDANTQVISQIETLSNLVGMLKNVFPAPPDPAKTQELMGSAFQQGMQMKISEGTNNNNTMLAMITMMKDMMMANRAPIDVTPKSFKSEMAETFSLMKDMGVLQPQRQEKTIMDLLGELRTVGIEPFKQQDPTDSLRKIKDVMGIVKDLTGKVMEEVAEKPGMFEEIMKAIGPALPQIMTMLTQGRGEGAGAVGGQLAAPAPQITSQPNPPVTQGEPVKPVEAAKVDPALMLLYEAVIGKDVSKFPTIMSMIQSMNGGSMMLGQLKLGTISPEVFYGMVQSWTQPVIHDQQFREGLREFVERFVQYVKNPTTQARSAVAPTYDAKCGLCGTVFAFNSQAEFDADEKQCGNETMKNEMLEKCPGMLVQIRPAQHVS